MPIINSVVVACGPAAIGSFTYNGFIPSAPHECIVRQVTYSSSEATKAIFVISCPQLGGVIGSVVNAESFQSNPGTRIQLHNFVRQPLVFQLLLPVTTGISVPVTDVAADYISINLEFLSH